jgi:hypothetical protein
LKVIQICAHLVIGLIPVSDLYSGHLSLIVERMRFIFS